VRLRGALGRNRALSQRLIMGVMFNFVAAVIHAVIHPEKQPPRRARKANVMHEIEPATKRRLGLAILVAALLLISLGTLPDVWRQRPFGIEIEPLGEGSMRLRDFTSHARMARLALEGNWHEDPSIYTPEAHLSMMSEWTGQRVNAAALPFGYSPTMVWVLAPFALWADPVGYLLWSLAGLAVVAWMLWPREDRPLVAGLIFLSPLVVK